MPRKLVEPTLPTCGVEEQPKPGDLSKPMGGPSAPPEHARRVPIEVRGRLLAQNTVLNLIGNVIPLLIGLAAIPYVVRGLGSEGFGILSIAWILLGYFSLVDLGLGRAMTKFVAEALGRGEMERLPAVVWTALGSQLVLGVVGSLILAAFVPVTVDRILKVPPALLHETKASFLLLAASLPIVLATTALRSILESAQRFDFVNYVKVPANISVFLLPAVALACGLRLPGIVLLLVLSRLGATLAYLVLCLRVLPVLGRHLVFDPKLLRLLMGYGGWVTVANLVNPILVYSDRFMIGALFSVAEVGYYAAPFEAVTRLWLVPASLAATLFPAFSAMGIESNRGKVELLYSRAIKSLLLLLGPVVLILIAFAKDVLQIWLGAEFAAKSTSVLQILAVGVLANSFAYIPFSLLQGLGRPDVVAKVFLVELPAYLAFAYVMIARGGIAGAALAWTLRVSIEALVLMVLAWKVFSISPRALVDGGLLRSLAAFAALGMAMLPGQLIFWNAPWIRCALSVFAVSIFVWAVWKYILDDTDRGPIAMMIRLFLPKTEKLR